MDMKKRGFKMNGSEYKSVGELVDKINGIMTHHADLFGKKYYPVDYVKLAFEKFVPAEQYEFDCDLQPVTCKGILSFVGKGVLQVYDDNGDLLIRVIGYRGNDVTMKKDEDVPLDIADACSVAESLVFKRCLKNLGVGADLSIDTALASCTKPKNLKFSSKKNSDGKGKKDSKNSNETTRSTDTAANTATDTSSDENSNTFAGAVKVVSSVGERKGKACFDVSVPEIGNCLACIPKESKLAKLIGQIKPGMTIEIEANVYNGTKNNYLEITKITNF